jgi:signal transduction histidine kinase
MKMFRNKEILQFALWFSLISIAAIVLGFSINTTSGILIIASITASGILFFMFTKARYKKIAQFSDQIDLVLHSAEYLNIGEVDEGELSILYSEITKMMLRIREQNDALKKEKEHLADSLADIAHQLRTPLTSVNLLLSLLANNPEGDERKAYVREAEDLLERMDWLVNSLLKLSRLDAGIVVFQNDQIEVDKLINKALRPFLITMELHTISIQIDVPKKMVIPGDSHWLSEALLNILKNCMESAGENGKIEIVGEDTPLFSEITVHDSGAGFEKEELPFLFDRFFRGKNSNTTGYGIGLALSKLIITKQGGAIMAKNHPEGGALFVIRFPK